MVKMEQQVRRVGDKIISLLKQNPPDSKWLEEVDAAVLLACIESYNEAIDDSVRFLEKAATAVKEQESEKFEERGRVYVDLSIAQIRHCALFLSRNKISEKIVTALGKGIDSAVVAVTEEMNEAVSKNFS
jgi:chaperonin GroEL (HSP60 family)